MGVNCPVENSLGNQSNSVALESNATEFDLDLD